MNAEEAGGTNGAGFTGAEFTRGVVVVAVGDDCDEAECPAWSSAWTSLLTRLSSAAREVGRFCSPASPATCWGAGPRWPRP